jgi:hypothetical protein
MLQNCGWMVKTFVAGRGYNSFARRQTPDHGRFA